MKKPRGKPFQKGNKISKGRPPMSEDEKKVTELTRTKFKLILRKYLNLTKEELKDVVENPSTPMLDLMVLSVMNKAMINGDEKKIEWFLEKLFGKTKEGSEIKVETGEGSQKTTVILNIPSNKREA